MLIKLTDTGDQTYNGTRWGENVTHGPTSGQGPLCSSGWLHFYEGLGVALFHNPNGAAFQTPHAWEARATVEKREGLKAGTRRLTTVRRVEYLPPTTEQLVTVAILLAFDVYDAEQDNGKWATWAIDWLSGADRTTAYATNAAYAASYAAHAASYAAAYATNAAYAAHAASYAAPYAANAAEWVKHADAVACAVFGY